MGNGSYPYRPYKKIEQICNEETGWRRTIYERGNGTRFSVALPPIGGLAGGHFYDEAEERRAAEKTFWIGLTSGPIKGTPE